MLLLFRSFVLNQDPAGIFPLKTPGQDSTVLHTLFFRKIQFKIQVYFNAYGKRPSARNSCHLRLFSASCTTFSIFAFLFIVAGIVH